MAVASAGTTTAASAQVALSQSATSAALSELERALSLRLFDRIGKRLVLNDQGRALLPRAQAMLDGAAGIAALNGQARLPATALRIGASTTLGNYLLPSLLGSLLGLGEAGPHDAWQARVMIDNTEAVCDALAAFRIDVGLIEGPCHRAEVAVMPWLQDELVLVASPERVARALARQRQLRPQARRVSPTVLGEMVWLLREPGSGTREVTDQLLLPHLHAWRRSIELGNSEAIKNAAAEGLGVACLSQWAVRDLLAQGALQVVPTTLGRMKRRCYLAVHHDKVPTPLLRAFVDQARAFRPGRPRQPPSCPYGNAAHYSSERVRS